MARQKNVYDTDEIAHLWAHQTQDGARNKQGNFYFEGKTIFSYGGHFPIATHVEYGGKKAIIYTTRTYSNTTAKHLHHVRMAIPGDATVFHFSHSSRHYRSFERAVAPPADVLKSVLDEYADTVKETTELLAKARATHNKESYAGKIDTVIDEWITFCSFYGLPVSEELLRAKAQAELGYEEVARLYREEKKAKQLAEAEELKKQLVEADRLAEYWRKHQTPPLFEEHRPTVRLVQKTYLRLSKDRTEVETSKGAKVPVKHAYLALKLIQRTMGKGEPYVRYGGGEENKKTYHLGHYAIDRIAVNGDLVAGCHFITWEEIERIAPEVIEVVGKEESKVVSPCQEATA